MVRVHTLSTYSRRCQDHDFPKRSLVWSFCPSDTTKPTYIAISIWSGGPQRIFYSTNPARFRATRFDDVGTCLMSAVPYTHPYIPYMYMHTPL